MGLLGAERESETRARGRGLCSKVAAPQLFLLFKVSHRQRSHGHMVPSLASVFQLVDMMGWRLQTADGVDILSPSPGSSSMVADLQTYLPGPARPG